MRPLPLLVCSALTVAAIGACPSVGPSSTTQLTSSPMPPSTGTTSRTIDSTGWVDPGGRTSDQVGRSQMSGMRATETGSERPTANNGGIPLPIDPPQPPRLAGKERGKHPSPDGESGAGAPPSSVVSRIARARCDRETFCNRIGSGDRAWPSDASCMADQRVRSRADVDAAGCPLGFASPRLSACLSAIRQAPCATQVEPIDVLNDCRSNVLCAY